MRSFDYTQDLDFEVCGEKFTCKTVRPEVLAAWEDAAIPETAVAALQVVDERILAFLADGNGQHDRYKAMREREENTPSMGQLRAILEWMVEVNSDRPTEPPSPSASGRGKSAASSTAA